MTNRVLWQEVVANLLAFWVLGYLGLWLAGLILPNAGGVATIASQLLWPWVVGIVIVAWLYLLVRGSR